MRTNMPDETDLETSNLALELDTDAYKLTPYPSKEDAKNWLLAHKDFNSTPILIPFYNENGRIEFLNPGDTQDRVRLLGSDGVRQRQDKNIFTKLGRIFKEKWIGRKLIPHMSQQRD